MASSTRPGPPFLAFRRRLRSMRGGTTPLSRWASILTRPENMGIRPGGRLRGFRDAIIACSSLLADPDRRRGPGVDPMRLPGILIFLFAWVCMVPGPRCDGAGHPASRPDFGSPSVKQVAAATGSAGHSSSGLLSRLGPWRHRIKSVLEQKDARSYQPMVQGPAPIPDHVQLPAGFAWAAARPTPLISRRC